LHPRQRLEAMTLPSSLDVDRSTAVVIADPIPRAGEANEPPTLPGKSLLRWSLAALALWIVLLRFPVVSDLISTEDGWKTALGILLRRRAQAGTEWIFTYGPLGFFLQTTHVPGLFAARWIFECAAKGALALLAIGVLRRERRIAVRIALFVVLACVPLSDDGAAYEILVVLAGFRLLGGDAGAWTRAAIALVLATLALVKFSLLVLATGAAAIVASQFMAEGRRARALTWFVAFVAGIAVAWTLAGQSLANFPPYVRAAADLAGGYSDAMGRAGSALELAAGLALLAACAAALLSRPGLPRGIARARAALLAFALILAFKEGFVRQDAYHAARFFAFALAAVPLAAVALPEVEWSALPRRILLLGAAAVAAIALGRALRSIPDAPESWPDPARALARGFRGLARPLALEGELEAQLEKERAAFALPRIRELVRDEPVDVLGNFEIFPMLAGVVWTPRYCFQGYAAYTDHTVERNAADLSGDRAPRFLLLDGGVVDSRYPGVEDCGSVLAALRGYRPIGGERGFLLLERTRAEIPPPRETLRVRLLPGEGFEVPGNGAPVLARIRCRKTIAGSLKGALLRTSDVAIRAELRGHPQEGRTATHRLLPSLSTSTFLLSPYLATVDDWIDAYAKDGAPASVSRFTILEGSAGSFEAFEVELDVLPELASVRIGAAEAADLHARVRER
jgi:hypothetical protein